MSHDSWKELKTNDPKEYEERAAQADAMLYNKPLEEPKREIGHAIGTQMLTTLLDRVGGSVEMLRGALEQFLAERDIPAEDLLYLGDVQKASISELIRAAEIIVKVRD